MEKGIADIVMLSEDFQPSALDVICGRGKRCYDHEGNRRLEALVITRLDEYSKAESKQAKSEILLNVAEQVRRDSPGGGFVKQDESGCWYKVGKFQAREKTSQFFRDALKERYKSSKVSKKKKRKIREQAKRASDRFQTGAPSALDRPAGVERSESFNLARKILEIDHDLPKSFTSMYESKRPSIVPHDHASTYDHHQSYDRVNSDLSTLLEHNRKGYSTTYGRTNTMRSRYESPHLSHPSTVLNTLPSHHGYEELDQRITPNIRRRTISDINFTRLTQFDHLAEGEEETRLLPLGSRVLSGHQQDQPIDYVSSTSSGKNIASSKQVPTVLNEKKTDMKMPYKNSTTNFVPEPIKYCPSLRSDSTCDTEPIPLCHNKEQHNNIADNSGTVFNGEISRQDVHMKSGNLFEPIPYSPPKESRNLS